MLKYLHIIVFSVILLICCLIVLIITKETYNPAQLTQLEVQDVYTPLPAIFSTDTNSVNHDIDVITFTESDILPQYRELHATNSDLAGWIEIGEVLSLPVMYTPNTPDFYLTHYFDKTAKSSGTPYIDERCNFNLMSDNVIIYGHNMNNNTVFCPLMQYNDSEFHQNNKKITFNTLYEQMEYQIIAVFTSTFDGVEENEYFQTIDFETEEDFDKFTQEINARSIYKTDMKLQYGDKFITLMTCTNVRDIDRINVIAVKIV